MVERLPCSISKCDRTILPNTAEITGGPCMPCFHKQQKEAHEAWIRENRKVINPYEGVTDPLKIIKTFHQKLPSDPLIAYEPFQGNISDYYKKLSDKETEIFVDDIRFLYKGKKEETKMIAACLGAFTQSDMSRFIEELISHEDYDPPFLFQSASNKIKKELLSKFMTIQDVESDLAKLVFYLSEKDTLMEPALRSEFKAAVSKHCRKALQTNRHTPLEENINLPKTFLGYINIAAQGESWPMYDGRALAPVVQIAVSDLPYVPESLQDIRYLCIFIHPDDPETVIDDMPGLVIRAYGDEDLMPLEMPEYLNRTSEPTILDFETYPDYPCDYQYPSIRQYISRNDYRGEAKTYNWGSELADFPVDICRANDCRIAAWPRWIQWPEDSDGTDFILQIDNYDLWEYGDVSSLYIFRDRETKEFSGLIQMS